jgi:hypothetical protein
LTILARKWLDQPPEILPMWIAGSVVDKYLGQSLANPLMGLLALYDL